MPTQSQKDFYKFWLLEQIILLEEQKLSTVKAIALINFIDEMKTNSVILEIFEILKNR